MLTEIWSMSSLLARYLAVACFSLFLTLWIENNFLSPLSKFPGPPIWKFTRIPYILSLRRGSFAHDMKAIHDRYGPVARIAPNELSIIEARAWQDIYGYKKLRGEFEKNPIWAQPSPNGVKSILHANEADHARMRRLLASAFSAASLRDHHEAIHRYSQRLVDVIGSRAKDKSVTLDMKDYYSWTTFDIIGHLGFQESFDCLRLERYHFWISFLFAHLKNGVFQACANFYPRLSSLINYFTPRALLDSAMLHHQMSCDKLHRRIALGKERNDFVSSFLRDDQRGMTLPELEANSSAIILAGSEGPSTCLIAVTNLLLRHPVKLEKLTEEICDRIRSKEDFSAEKLESMPYLRAVILEGLRMAPPVPIGIPRVVPDGGANVAGVYIPGKTFISVPQYAAYRFRGNFVLADHFLPERWLEPMSPLLRPSSGDPLFDSTTFINDNKDILQPFSVGPRDCVGKELGMFEVRLILTRLLWNFKITVPPEVGIKRFEDQKSFALWEREPFMVELRKRTSP